MSGHFFANYMFIFHKTEIQTVLLKCLRSLNLNWYKSYDKKRKRWKHLFLYKVAKKREMEIFVFCVINFELIEVQTFSAPQNDNNNNNFVDGGKLAKNGQKTAILTGSWGQLPIDNEYAGLL